MRRFLLVIAIFSVLMLALAACGSDDDDPENGVQLQNPPTSAPVTPSVVPPATTKSWFADVATVWRVAHRARSYAVYVSLPCAAQW